jgi:hypothetical protein
MELAELTPDAIDYIFENIVVERLNGWERGFIESTSERWDRIRHLTDPQKITLGQIWDEQP